MAVGGETTVRGHPAVRTLLLTEPELTAWLLDERTGETRQLNAAAAAVWALLDRPCSRHELIAELVATFGLDDHIAATTVDQALATFGDAGLLDDGDQGSDDTSGDDPDPGGDGIQRLTRAPDP